MAGIDNSSSGMDVTRDVPQVSERPRSATGNYNKDRDGQAWFSGSGLRRRLDKRGAAPKPRDQNADDAPQMQGSHAGAAASQLSRTAAGGLGMVALVALVVVALMLAGCVAWLGQGDVDWGGIGFVWPAAKQLNWKRA